MKLLFLLLLGSAQSESADGALVVLCSPGSIVPPAAAVFVVDYFQLPVTVVTVVTVVLHGQLCDLVLPTRAIGAFSRQRRPVKTGL